MGRIKFLTTIVALKGEKIAKIARDELKNRATRQKGITFNDFRKHMILLLKIH